MSFEVRGFSRDMVVMLQGFIVLFSGAMAYVLAPIVASAIGSLHRKSFTNGGSKTEGVNHG